MSIIDSDAPDYDLPDQVSATTSEQLKAIADPLRSVLLDLVLERAATINELAQAVDRPKGTVAHHVNVLVAAGLLRIVRTRRVRAIEERFYGRTGRTIVISPERPGTGSVPGAGMASGTGSMPGARTASAAGARSDSPPARLSLLAQGAAEAGDSPDLRSTLRRARIPAERAAEFWQGVVELADEFTRLARSGDTIYGFAAGLYPTTQRALPDPLPEDHHG
jgi:DNA-binding transcriptional ArsR family regulator